MLQTIFSYFLAGIGKIYVSFYCSIVQCLINIPIAILLSKYLNTSGIILALNLNLFFGIFILGFQSYKIIFKQAYGFWNK